MRSCRRRRERAEGPTKKRKTRPVWRRSTPTSRRAPPPAANPLKEWDWLSFRLSTLHGLSTGGSPEGAAGGEFNFPLWPFSYHHKFVWRTWRSLPCVLLPGTWPSSAGWPGTAGAWKKASTQRTTFTWRRRTARGWEPPVFPHADFRSFCPFESLLTDTSSHGSTNQGVSHGWQKKEEM